MSTRVTATLLRSLLSSRQRTTQARRRSFGATGSTVRSDVDMCKALLDSSELHGAVLREAIRHLKHLRALSAEEARGADAAQELAHRLAGELEKAQKELERSRSENHRLTGELEKAQKELERARCENRRLREGINKAMGVMHELKN